MTRILTAGLAASLLMVLTAMSLPPEREKPQPWLPPVTEVVSTLPPQAEPKPQPEPDKPALGVFRITVYTPHCDGGVWGYQTASGATSEHLATCAVDPAVIPLGSVIEVNGLTLTAADTGSAVKGSVVDVFWDGDIESAQEWLGCFGTEHTVYLMEGVTSE